MGVKVYKTSSLPWPTETRINYGYDIETAIQFGKEQEKNDKFVKIRFPNGKEISSYDCVEEDGAYLELFDLKDKKIWQAERRAMAKEIPLDELLSGRYSVESIYERLHDYCVQGKNICVNWNGKMLYSLDASWANKDKNIDEIKNSTPQDYEHAHPSVDTFNAEYFTSAGLTIAEIADKIVEANQSGQNIYTLFKSLYRIYSAWSHSVDDVYICKFLE